MLVIMKIKPLNQMNELNKIVCTCANLTEAQIKNYFKGTSDPNITFEKFLNDTKAVLAALL